MYSGNSVTYRISAPAAGAEPLLAFVQNRSGALLTEGTKVTLAFAPAQTIPLEG